MDGGMLYWTLKNASVLCLSYIKKNVKQTNVLSRFGSQNKQTNKIRKKITKKHHPQQKYLQHQTTLKTHSST